MSLKSQELKNSSYFFFQSPSYLKIPATPPPNLALSNALIKLSSHLYKRIKKRKKKKRKRKKILKRTIN